jgi:hypothetical protein
MDLYKYEILTISVAKARDAAIKHLQTTGMTAEEAEADFIKTMQGSIKDAETEKRLELRDKRRNKEEVV